MSPGTDLGMRWAYAAIDAAAFRHNVGVLRAAAGDSELWAVVKADGYGHRAVTAATLALEAGATGLCVALLQEGVELRQAGVSAPILLLSEQPWQHADDVVAHDLIPTIYSATAAAEYHRAAVARDTTVDVHVKVDTGMQRVGVRPDEATELVSLVRELDGLRLAGVFTHLAVADSVDDEHVRFTTAQLDRFDRVLDELDLDDDVIVHAANSAGVLAHPSARRRMVRTGIAMYGISPGADLDDLAAELRPVLSLRARVTFVKRVVAGSRISYGLRHRFEHDTTVATLPIGYADGVPRRLSSVGGDVLLGGRRCPIVGVVTMDQLMVDVGDLAVEIGDEAVLIGEQHGERILATDWADALDTIGYEIVCGISARVPRVVRR